MDSSLAIEIVRCYMCNGWMGGKWPNRKNKRMRNSNRCDTPAPAVNGTKTDNKPRRPAVGCCVIFGISPFLRLLAIVWIEFGLGRCFDEPKFDRPIARCIHSLQIHSLFFDFYLFPSINTISSILLLVFKSRLIDINM